MGSIFDGLSKMGLSGIDSKNIFSKNDEKKAAKQAIIKETPQLEEKDMIFTKEYECPICYSKFGNKTVLSGKAKLTSVEENLRQKYERIEPLKYDVVACVNCGHAALTRFFKPLSSGQRNLVNESICSNFKGLSDRGHETIDFEEAFERYQLALANSIVKKAKASETAYTCLKAGWLCESWIESLEKAEERDAELIAKVKEYEKEFTENAYEGLSKAVSTEMPPICGMDESTVNYLLAVLALNTGHIDASAKLVSTIITSRTAPSKLKDRARELKPKILAAVKQNQ